MIDSNLINFFLNDLKSCERKSDFDIAFLDTATVAVLMTYDVFKWKLLYKQRLEELSLKISSEFDWTKRSRTVNDIWYQFALRLAKTARINVTDILFPGVHINNDDRKAINEGEDFTDLYYSDDHRRLMSFNRSIRLNVFASYDENFILYPLSLREMEQIRNKTGAITDSLTKKDWDSRWVFMCDKFFDVSNQSIKDIQEALYPLFKCVEAYFYDDKMPEKDRFNKIHDLMYSMYTDDLKYLAPDTVLSFYGQVIEIQSTPTKLGYSVVSKGPEESPVPISEISPFTRDDLERLVSDEAELARSDVAPALDDTKLIQIEAEGSLNAVLLQPKSELLINVLLDCLGSSDPVKVNVLMLSLAEWISLKNPHMLIDHPLLNAVYEKHSFGKFFKLKNLKNEMSKLAVFDNELNVVSKTKINELLLLSMSEDNFEACGERMYTMLIDFYRVRSDYNHKTKRTKGSPKKLLSNSDYPYHQEGINLQLIRMAQLLSGSGFLKEFGQMEGYDRLLFPFLNNDYDNISGELLSNIPLSHKLVPETRDHLVILNNSVQNYNLHHLFENVNAMPPRPFTVFEFERIQCDLSMRFRHKEYERITEYRLPPLNRVTLKALINLINLSLNFKGLRENYTLKYVDNLDLITESRERGVIYLQIVDNSIHYAVIDVWDPSNKVYKDALPACSGKTVFLDLNEEDRLKYLIRFSALKGHTRPSYFDSASKSKNYYQRAYLGYATFNEFYKSLDETEKSNLDLIRMRLDNFVYTFSDIYANGFPICMSSASRWFCILVFSYLPDYKFAKEIEQQSINQGANFLDEQRKIAVNRKQHPDIIDREVSISQTTLGLFQPLDEAMISELLVISDDIGNADIDNTNSKKDDANSKEVSTPSRRDHG